MNCVPKCVGKFKIQICGFVCLNRIQARCFRVFTKIENKYRIKNKPFVHVSHKSCKNTCFNLDFEHLKKIMILANVGPYLRSDEFLHSKKKRMGEGKTGMEEKERGNCKFHFGIQNQVYLR